MEQIERIQEMEQRMRRATKAVMDLSAALGMYEVVQGDFASLSEYYGREEWKQDFAIVWMV